MLKNPIPTSETPSAPVQQVSMSEPTPQSPPNKSEHLQTYLDQATISPEIFQLRPDYRALLIAASGITPSSSSSSSSSTTNNSREEKLIEAETAAKTHLSQTGGTSSITEIPHIAEWRQAYKAFGAKPNKTRNSLEALFKRAVTTGLPRINNLTNMYNAISVKNLIPLGGEDLDKYTGPPRLIVAKGNEEFHTNSNGQNVVEYPDVGEVVWCDDVGVTCRRWNWRQGVRTALSDETTSVLFICDALGVMDDDALEATGEELVAELRRMGPNVVVAKRTIATPSV